MTDETPRAGPFNPAIRRQLFFDLTETQQDQPPPEEQGTPLLPVPDTPATPRATRGASEPPARGVDPCPDRGPPHIWRKFVPKMYSFKLPPRGRGEEWEVRYTRMPPSWALLDQLLGVICNVGCKVPTGIMDLHWALESLRGIPNKHGEYHKVVTALIEGLQDHLIERYAALDDQDVLAQDEGMAAVDDQATAVAEAREVSVTYADMLARIPDADLHDDRHREPEDEPPSDPRPPPPAPPGPGCTPVAIDQHVITQVITHMQNNNYSNQRFIDNLERYRCRPTAPPQQPATPRLLAQQLPAPHRPPTQQPGPYRPSAPPQPPALPSPSTPPQPPVSPRLLEQLLRAPHRPPTQQPAPYRPSAPPEPPALPSPSTPFQPRAPRQPPAVMRPSRPPQAVAPRQPAQPPLPSRQPQPPLPSRQPQPPLPSRQPQPPLPSRQPQPPLPSRQPQPPLPSRHPQQPLPQQTPRQERRPIRLPPIPPPSRAWPPTPRARTGRGAPPLPDVIPAPTHSYHQRMPPTP